MMARAKRKRRIHSGNLSRAVELYGKGASTINGQGRPVQEDVLISNTYGELFGPEKGVEGFADTPDSTRVDYRLRVRKLSLDLKAIEYAVIDSIKYNVTAAMEDVKLRRGAYAILHLQSVL